MISATCAELFTTSLPMRLVAFTVFCGNRVPLAHSAAILAAPRAKFSAVLPIASRPLACFVGERQPHSLRQHFFRVALLTHSLVRDGMFHYMVSHHITPCAVWSI